MDKPGGDGKGLSCNVRGKINIFFLTLSIISCIFVHDFRLESSSVIIGVTGLSAWEAHLFNIVVVYFCYPCKNSGVTPYFVRRVGST